MVKITLFKDIPFNNGCVMSNFLSFQDQKNFFDSYPSNKKLVLNDVKISKLDAPVLINLNISQLFNFTYGAIDFNNQRIIYFSINRFEIETANKTWIYFNIDYWETYRYPINNENGLKLGRSRISRCSLDLGNMILKPYSPNAIKYSKLFTFPRPKSFVFTLHHNANNIDYFYLFRSSNSIQSIIARDLSQLPNGITANEKINVNEITGIWILPFDLPLNDYMTLIYSDTGVNYDDRLYQTTLNLFNRTARLYDLTFNSQTNLKNYNKNKSELAITDAFNNIIWVSKNNNFGIGFKVTLNVTSVSCVCSCFLKDVNENDDYSINGSFTIPCESIQMFNDYFKNYYIQERPFLAELRSKQNELQVYSSVLGMGSTIGGATVGGALAGGPYGAIAGAIAGVTGSTIGTIGNYFINEEFNKFSQKIEDAKALVQTDTLSLFGNGITPYISDLTGVSLIEISYDDDSYNAFIEDVNTFGYYYDREYNDLDNLLISNSTFKITCNCEVENVPAIAEQSIKARLNAGVKFIRPT